MEIVENKATTSKPRLFRWALWWGLGIVTICLVILIVYAITNPTIDEANSPLTSYFYSLMYRFGIWPAVLYIGFIGPIIEEVSFRLWGNGKLWTGIVSVILISVWSIAIGWWVALLTILAGTVILTVFNDNKRKRLFALMLLSSVVFALAHLGNYNEDKVLTIVGIIHKLGFGLFASYLVINHNILWSMGLHIINNSLLAIPMGLAIGQASNEVVIIDNENFFLEVRPILRQNDSINSKNGLTTFPDSTYYFGSTAQFARQVLLQEALQKTPDRSADTIIITPESYFPKCWFTITYKNKPFDYHGIIVSMLGERLITIDTVYSTMPDSTDRKLTTLNIASSYDPFTRASTDTK